MSIYRIHFKWKEKEVSIKAKSLDLTHPYFVSMKGLILPQPGGLIIDPSKDEVLKDFGDADHIMIPFQTVSLIEELKEEDFRLSGGTSGTGTGGTGQSDRKITTGDFGKSDPPGKPDKTGKTGKTGKPDSRVTPFPKKRET